MVKVIEIENCWMITEYNNHNSDKIKNGQLPPGDVFMVYFLRFLLFCDQCHDFCEEAERNNWIHNVTGKGVIKKKIYEVVYQKIDYLVFRKIKIKQFLILSTP